MLKAAFGAAAVVAAVVISTTLFMNYRNQPPVGHPDPTPGPSPSIGQPTLTPSLQPSLPPVSHSLDLIWSQIDSLNAGHVAWLGDRFVLVDLDSGAASTSTDGETWQGLEPGDDPGYAELLQGDFAIWQDDAVGWWNPQDGRPDIAGATPPPFQPDFVRIVRPPAEPATTTPFDGPVGAIGIGPMGLVARVHSNLDWDAWVATKLGEDWVSHYTEVAFEDGILDIGMDNGPGLHVVWADEGFELGDFQDWGFGWYSPDGQQWTATPEFPVGITDIVGVSDGFIARGQDGMWHSADGMTWRSPGEVEDHWEGFLLPWIDGVLVTDGVRRFDHWISNGHSAMPMAAERAAATEESFAWFGTGSLGLVSVINTEREILFTRDGVDWKVQPMPSQMVTDTFTRREPAVAVGERSVLVLVWSGTREAPVPSLWLGTPKP